MLTFSPTENISADSLAADHGRLVCNRFGRAGRSLNSLLQDSTVGVAFFDRSLHCKALNGALSRMIGVPVRKQIGKPMHLVFSRQAPKLKPAFQHVWGTGHSLSNVKLKAKLSPKKETRHWLVNFYPVKNELGQVQLVAAAFSEVTKSRDVELKLGRIRNKFRSGVLIERAVLGEEFSELSEQTFEVVGRSVELLKTSISLRSYVSEIQLETGLERLALTLAVSRPQEAPLNPELSPVNPEADLASHVGAQVESEMLTGGPSFRERQVLRHLADGKSNKEIGDVLEISTRTVESYRARIMIKLDLHSTAALVRYAIREKIIEA